jgi:hypothetical protein
LSVRVLPVLGLSEVAVPIAASFAMSGKRVQFIALSSKLNPWQLVVSLHLTAQASALVVPLINVPGTVVTVPSPRYEYPIGPDVIGGVIWRWSALYCEVKF